MRVQKCRICSEENLALFLDLGETALAHSFLPPDCLGAQETRAPLRLVLCQTCGLVQIDEEVPPEVLFKNYIYVSGTSDLIKTHAAGLARRLVGTYGLAAGELMLEAASNDGTVLQAFQRQQLRTVGIEPAENIAAKANAGGIETVCNFFDLATARRVRDQYGPAKLILARHVLAHVADLHGFVRGFPVVLGPEGVAVVEMPHLLPFFENLEYDTVYHEHLCYFSVRVLRELFHRLGMEIIDVQETAIHGGSIVVAAQKQGGPWQVQPTVAKVIAREDARKLHCLTTWQQFALNVGRSRDALLAELDRLHQQGRRLAGYGAPAKGMTLLAYCGIGPERLPYLVDKSPHKQGMYTPGHHLPIFAPDRLVEEQPDVVLMLAWNFATEIANQQSEYLGRGGKFLMPIPRPHFWRKEHALAA